ncbi:Type I secretion system ATPase family protein [Sphingopyxis sp. LC81]|nr:Type I secretion system ATPase family protein [Sphingopyxis sp. LC81]
MTVPAFIRRNLLQFAGLLAAAFAYAGAAIFLAWSIARLFDTAVGRGAGNHSLPIHPAASSILAIMVLLVTAMVQRRMADGMGLAYVHWLRLRLFRHLLRAITPPSLKGKRVGLLLPFVGDLGAIRQWVGDGLARLILGVTITLTLLAYILIRHFWIGCWLATAVMVLAVVAWRLNSPLDQVTRDIRRQRAKVSGFVTGRLEAAATVVSMGRSVSELRKLERRSLSLTAAARRRAWLVGALRGLSQSSAAIMMLLLLLAASKEVRVGTMTNGDLLGLMSLIGIMGHALHDTGRAFERFIPGRVAMQRIDRLMALPRRFNRRKAHARLDMAGLNIDKLTLPGMTGIIDLAATPGEVILLDGPVGSGKSALMAILGRLNSPPQGAIRIDGADLESLSGADAQRLIGLASHAVPLLPGSVDMNLRYRQRSASDLEVLQLADQLGLDSIGLNLRHMIGEPRTSLSGGQHEALLIARALLGQPSLLLLDAVEGHLPDSMIDRLATLIANYPGVVIMVARRHGLRRIANRGWRIEEGSIRESCQNLEPVASTGNGKASPK